MEFADIIIIIIGAAGAIVSAVIKSQKKANQQEKHAPHNESRPVEGESPWSFTEEFKKLQEILNNTDREDVSEHEVIQVPSSYGSDHHPDSTESYTDTHSEAKSSENVSELIKQFNQGRHDYRSSSKREKVKEIMLEVNDEEMDNPDNRSVTEAEIEFDARKAFIYKEILTPKFEEI